MSFSDIPDEIIYKYILPNVVRPPMKLLDWIPNDFYDSYSWNLSSNPNAIDILKKNLKVFVGSVWQLTQIQIL